MHAVEVAGVSKGLQELCYKPLGSECATQSLIQYWQLNRTAYEVAMGDGGRKGKGPDPKYCLDHWSTQCLSRFSGPIDPHIVLGGFPKGPLFR
jgi:Niemann-Pick C1 protein